MFLLSGCGSGGLSNPVSSGGSLPGLSPATPFAISNGIGIVSGEVGEAHNVYSFRASEGNLISLDVDVTEILRGTEYEDDDSHLYLFDSDGQLLDENDDEEHDKYESLIQDFTIPADGIYYAVITTYGNVPELANNLLLRWSDTGESRIRYNLTLTGVSRY